MPHNETLAGVEISKQRGQMQVGLPGEVPTEARQPPARGEEDGHLAAGGHQQSSAQQRSRGPAFFKEKVDVA
jgi:hypothetical protein